MPTVSNEVFIRRKPALGGFQQQNQKTINEMDTYWKIGAVVTSGGPLRGLSADEEKTILSPVIGVDGKDPINFMQACTEYWNDISVNIPAGKVGLKLEIGFEYPNEEAMKNGEAAVGKENEWKVKQQYGVPINYPDYVLYRYCLVYPRVARNVNDIEKSNKIRFYLYTKAAEIKSKYEEYSLKKKANVALLELLQNDVKIDLVLAAYQRFEIVDIQEKEMVLNEYALSEPHIFLSIVEDEELSMRAYIEKALSKGVLQRIPNTETITVDGITTLGSNMRDAIFNLKHEKNASLFTRIQAQLGNSPASIETKVVPDLKELAAGSQKTSTVTK